MSTDWREALQSIGEVNFEQKPDGTVKIDVTTPPKDTAGELENNLIQPGPTEQPEAQKSAPVTTQPTKDNTDIQESSRVSRKLDVDMKKVLSIGGLLTEGELIAALKIAKRRRPILSKEAVQNNGVDDSGFLSEDELLRSNKSGIVNKTVTSVGKQACEDNTLSVDPTQDGVVGRQASVESTQAEGIKEWEIRKEGELRLVGRECETHVGVFIEKGRESVEAFRVARSGHSWRELINQAEWESRLEEYVKASGSDQ